MNLKSAIQNSVAGWNGKVCAHVMPWYGDGNVHRSVPYKSNDKYTIARQLSLMQSVGIDVVILTWQGPLATFQHETAKEMVVQCGEREMGFMLLMDPWIAKLGQTGVDKTTNVINALHDSTVQDILNAPAYVPEKYVLDFGTGADLSKLASSFPTLQFLKKNDGFSWPMIPWNDSAYKGYNGSANMKIPGVCSEFNDAGQPRADGSYDYSQSWWGGPARVLDSQAGNFIVSQYGSVKRTHKYVAYVTWNDYDERSSGPLEANVALITGESF